MVTAEQQMQREAIKHLGRIADAAERLAAQAELIANRLGVQQPPVAKAKPAQSDPLGLGFIDTDDAR